MHSGKPESFQTSQLLLAKGQSHFGQLPRGTVIRVAAGSVALVQRINLERCMLVQQTTLQRGAVHGVAVSAWVEIATQVDADVLVMVPRAVPLVEELRAGLDAVLAHLGVRRKDGRSGSPWRPVWFAGRQ